MSNEFKVYSKKDFMNFMNTLTIIKDFNDSVTFDKGEAYIRSSNGTLLIKVNCECLIDIILTKISNKISIFNAYVGDNVEIGKDTRNYIINNGSDIIHFPIAPEVARLTKDDFDQKFNAYINENNLLFKWDIDENKFSAIRKYFEGFGTNEIVFEKDENDNNIKLKIGEENTIGFVQINNFEIENSTSSVDLKKLQIKTSSMFEYISSLGKCFNGVLLSLYYNPENDFIMFVSDIHTDFCNLKMFRARPRILSTY